MSFESALGVSKRRKSNLKWVEFNRFQSHREGRAWQVPL